MKRLLISSLICLAGLPAAAFAEYGHLSGQFVLDGKAPTAEKIVVTKDVQFCGKHNLMAEDIVVNSENNGIANIVVYLYLGRRDKPPKPHPSYADLLKKPVSLDNLNCRYEPHVVALRTGQTLKVGNKDAIGHNTKIDTVKNPAANPIIPAGAEAEFVFKKEERLPVNVSCSIHPWMTARVLIKDTPYMAVTDKDGKFKIENLPEGEYTFQVWHEAGGYVDKVKIGGKNTKWTKGRFEQKIAEGDNDLGELVVDIATLK